MSIKRLAGALALSAAALASFSAAADDARDGAALFGDIEERALRYEFRVEGERVGIGEGRITRTAPETWRVEISYDIKVEVLGVDLYTLDMDATEVYRGARLVALKSRAVENGDEHEIDGAAEGELFRYTHNGEPGEVAADVVPSTQLWRRDLLTRTRVLHVVEGEPFDRSTERIGTRTFETPEGERPLDGVHIDTPYETAELWFDEEGLMQRCELERMGVTMHIRRLRDEG
ncbi:MAG: DUF6134 family protein [Marivibrio sp.]|uniref:DUF6134 family protein n=1 Tax=Marivibrio sp. TaxID=2039719 RepID=UPI0032EE371B